MHRVHRPREAHLFADVPPPVPRVRRRQPLPGDRRDHRYAHVVGGALEHVSEGLAHRRLEAVHRRRVERDVARQQPVREAPAVQLLAERPELLFAPADHRARGGVLAGDLHPRASALRLGQQLGDPRPVEPDREHPPGPGPGLLEPRPVVDERRRLLERQHSARVRGRDLSGAVTDRAVGLHPPGREHLGERRLHEEDDGLGEAALVDRLRAGRPPSVAERVPGVAAPDRVDPVHHLREHRVRLLELDAAARPLRSLAGEHHRDPGLALRRRADGRGIGLERREGVQEARPILHREGGPHREEGRSPAEVAGEGVEVRVVLREVLAEPARDPDQRVVRAGREGDDVPALRGGGDGPCPPPGGPVLAHDAVPVRAAEPERVDPDGDRPVRERLAPGLHPHRTAVEIDLRVRGAVARRHRSEGAVLEHEQDLDEGAVECRRLHVSEVALDARDPEGLAPARTEGVGDRAAFDGIADRGPRGVGLHVVEGRRIEPGARACLVDHRHLRVAGRCGDVAALRGAFGPVGRARGIDGGALDEGEDPVPVRLGDGEGFDREDEGALGAEVSVRARVEAPASPFGADDAKRVEPGALQRAREVVDGRDQSLAAVARPEGGDGGVGSRQGRRARRAVRHRRAHEVEVVRDPVRQHREADPRHGVLVHAARLAEVGDGGHLRTEEHPGRAVAHRLQAPPGTLQGLRGASEEHPHERARLHHLVVREPEEPPVDPPLVVVPDEALPRAREASRTRVRAEWRVPPAVARLDGFADDPALPEQRPEGVVGPESAREAMGVGDDRDRCVGPAGGHGFSTSVRECGARRGGRSGPAPRSRRIGPGRGPGPPGPRSRPRTPGASTDSTGRPPRSSARPGAEITRAGPRPASRGRAGRRG